jgi:ArsR family transcriptional regulator
MMKLEPSTICKVLSVETRLKIIKLLKTKGPLGAQDIAGYLGVSTAAISQHLKILRQVGIATCERRGFCIPYSINEAVLGQCRQLLAESCLCGCHEIGRPELLDLGSASLAELQNYAQALEEQLKAVRERLKVIENEQQS